MTDENNEVGRPPYIKTDEDTKTVEALAIAGCKQSLIADIVKVSEPTLRKNFRKELNTSKARANAIISQSLFKKAKDGNVVAQIFWLKTQAGWKEKNYHDLLVTILLECTNTLSDFILDGPLSFKNPLRDFTLDFRLILADFITGTTLPGAVSLSKLLPSLLSSSSSCDKKSSNW